MSPDPNQAPDPVALEERFDPRPRWETVECTCPDWCERDHELD